MSTIGRSYNIRIGRSRGSGDRLRAMLPGFMGVETEMNLGRTKAFVLAGVGAVGLLAGLVANLETLFDFANRVVGSLDPPPSPDARYIRADGPFERRIEEMADERSFRIGAREYRQGYRYSLALHIEARFSDPVFNTADYLKGIASLTLTESPEETTSVAVRDRHSLRRRFDWLHLDARWGPVYQSGTRADTRSVKWTVYIKHERKPEADSVYTFRSGPRAWPLTLPEMNWRSFPLNDVGEERWWGTQGSALVVLDDPDWVALRSARILRLAEGEGSLLEAVVHNQSSVAVPLSGLMLRAARRKTILCHHGTSMRPPPRQEVTVNWSRLVDHGSDGNTDAVRTRLRNEPVRVKAFYDPESCSKPDTFEAEVPLETTIPAGELSRISLKIEETAGSGNDGPSFGLAGWKTLLVSVTPADRVSPPSVLVRR